MENHELIALLKMAERVAWSLHGLPYRWGGDDPMLGFDCSGMCIEILKSVGILPREGDWTAQALFDLFHERIRQNAQLGCLAFWHGADPVKIIHVEFCLDSKHTMGASGGGSATTSFEGAAKANAFIKVRPIRLQNLVGFRDPFR